MVWSVFCDGVASNAFRRMSGVDIVAIIGIDMFMYLFGCTVSLLLARLPYAGKHRWIDALRFSRKDAVAIMVKFHDAAWSCSIQNNESTLN